MQAWGCSRARDIFETPRPSPQKTTCSFSYRFRGSSGISALYQGLRVPTLDLLLLDLGGRPGLGRCTRQSGLQTRDPKHQGNKKKERARILLGNGRNTVSRALLRRRSIPNMTGRMFHRTKEMIPRRPWKAKSPFASRPIRISINKGMRGVSVRYVAVLLPFISIIRSPGCPVILVPEKRTH